MRHQPHRSLSPDSHAAPVEIFAHLQRAPGLDGDEDHVGVRTLRLDFIDFRKTLDERARVLVILGQALDVVLERVDPGSRQHACLTHPAAEHLAPAARRRDQLTRAA